MGILMNPKASRFGLCRRIGDDAWYITFKKSRRGGWNVRGAQRVQAKPAPAIYPVAANWRYPTPEAAVAAVVAVLAER